MATHKYLVYEDGKTRAYSLDLSETSHNHSGVYIPVGEKGVASGVATLDAGGKIPVTQLPNSVMEYQGAWAASTNSPLLANGAGNTGDIYRASDAGTVNFGAGNIVFALGDWAIYNGTIWEKSQASDIVVDVLGTVITGFASAAGTVSGTDTILQAINKLDGNVALKADASALGDYLLVADFTDAAVSGKLITGFVAGAGVVDVADTILGAIEKLDGNVALKADAGHNHDGDYEPLGAAAAILAASISDGDTTHAPDGNAVYDALAAKLATADFTDAAVTGKLITGFSSSAGSVSGTDSILQAIGKLDGNIQALGGSEAKSLINDNGGAITIRQCIYIKSNGHVDLAAKSLDLIDARLGLVAAVSIASSAPGLITVKYGALVGGFTGLTPGKRQFVGTAGALTETAPNTSGECVYEVGRAVSATELSFEPKYITDIV